MGDKVLIINGVANSGKDTFVDMVQFAIGKGRAFNRISTIDFVFDLCQRLFEIPKDRSNLLDKERKFLSEMKKALNDYDGRFFEIAVSNIKNCFNHHSNCIVTVMCREPEEIARFKEEFGDTNCLAVLIRNPTEEEDIPDNKSDKGVFKYQYDYTIRNNGSKGELLDATIKFLNEIGEIEE